MGKWTLVVESFTGYEANTRDGFPISVADDEWAGNERPTCWEEAADMFKGQTGVRIDKSSVQRRTECFRVIDADNAHHIFETELDAKEWVADAR